MTEAVAQRDPVEQLAEEFLGRLRAGEHPAISDYTSAHPELADEIHDLFPALVMMEQVKPGEPSQPVAPANAADESPDQLGDYRIIREVARGGMGIVYEAEQQSLGRHVALKVLPAQRNPDAIRLLRFRREARSAARLHHSNIVPVFEVGACDGVHYYAMQFIQGQGLDEVLQELRRLRSGERPTDVPGNTLTGSLAEGLQSGQFPDAPAFPGSRSKSPRSEASAILTEPLSHYFRSVARLGVQAAEALAYAHSQHVLHRDVKPSNLLLDWQGTLWLTDFGLAKDDTDDLTRTGDIVGTLRYMAPERFHRVSDPRTDVYALGITLYELLTLRPAFPETDRILLLHQIAKSDPPRPRVIELTIPRDLETIVLKSIEKEPARRYASADDMAEDLRRFLSDRPIRARRASWREQGWRWCRRNPGIAASLASAITFLALLVAGLSVSAYQVWQAKQDVEAAKGELEQTLAAEKRSAYFQRIALADRELAANNLLRAEKLLDQCPDDLRGWEWQYLKRLSRSTSPKPLQHDNLVFCCDVSPDGRWIVSGDVAGTVYLWDIASRKRVWKRQGPATVCRRVEFGSDGDQVAADHSDGVTIWSVAAGVDQPLRSWSPPAGTVFQDFAWVPGDRLIALTYQEADVTDCRIWDCWTGKPLFPLSAHRSFVERIFMGPDGKSIASMGDDEAVLLWDITTGSVLSSFPGHGNPTGIAFSSDGSRLAVSAGGLEGELGPGRVTIWELATGQQLAELVGHGSKWVAFSPDGRRLVSAGIDQSIKVWDTATGQEIFTLRGHRDWVKWVTFTPDGQQLVSASDDRTIRIWDGRPVADDEPVVEESITLPHDNSVNVVAYHPTENHLLATGITGGAVVLWDVRARQIVQRYATDVKKVKAVAFDPTGALLASGGNGMYVTLWDTTTGTLKTQFEHQEWVVSLAFSRDGASLVTASWNGMITIWDVASGMVRRSFKTRNPFHYTVAFSPDLRGRCLAASNADGTVRVWDTTAGREVERSPLRHQGVVEGIAFSPDGHWLVSGGWDRVLRIWDARTWETKEKLVTQSAAPEGLAFSPDSRSVAWGATDSSVNLWHLDSDRIETFRGHRDWVRSVAFSPDGRSLASASRDGTVKVWRVPWAKPAIAP